ncbi:YbaB/EbfC family nucleoid-associated protein [Actinoplanes sp. N902-109]|uniref:YbaB/EbfC family nucleoid-associated protein n=1 Tax=Actinoplanes sp. (strain N902-109) TaxID=649831 RepID=UPI0003294003|nr:YbaB/EbfC family nucleoid-associated protein [Actinoplanes sp. N902-109]AGL15611.1 hypothetical protein L083_2101 [Actinoplanes sp. N902-109]
MYDVGAAEDWLDTWVSGVNERAAGAAELSRQVAALSGAARSADGSVRVTVDAGGNLVRLELPDRELSERIMTTVRRAQAELAAAVSATVERTVGADSETGRAVIHSYGTRYPSPEPEDDDRAR